MSIDQQLLTLQSKIEQKWDEWKNNECLLSSYSRLFMLLHWRKDLTEQISNLKDSVSDHISKLQN